MHCMALDSRQEVHTKKRRDCTVVSLVTSSASSLGSFFKTLLGFLWSG